MIVKHELYQSLTRLGNDRPEKYFGEISYFNVNLYNNDINICLCQKNILKDLQLCFSITVKKTKYSPGLVLFINQEACQYKVKIDKICL